MKYLSSLENKDLSGKTCLLRVDFNVADSELSGKNMRVKSALPTIQFLIGRGAKVAILSHRGRPQNAASSKYQASSFTMKPFVKILSSLLKKPVRFIGFENGFNPSEIKKTIAGSGGKIFLLENLRFNSVEEKNDKNFAKQLASLGDFYVNDAFSVSHRANASVEAITKFLPSYAGLSLENELKNLDKAIKNPKKPLVVILGGAKISDKIGIIDNFMKRTDKFLIGGGIANTFLAAKKIDVGGSLYEEDKVGFAGKLLKSEKIILPVDWIVEKNRILDIGPKTVKEFLEIIKKAKTIVWNGPMGYIENPKFSKGSKAVMKAVLESPAFSIIGGGETTGLLSDVQPPKNIFVSTGGGAMLDYLAGKKLPGIEALK